MTTQQLQDEIAMQLDSSKCTRQIVNTYYIVCETTAFNDLFQRSMDFDEIHQKYIHSTEYNYQPFTRELPASYRPNTSHLLASYRTVAIQLLAI